MKKLYPFVQVTLVLLVSLFVNLPVQAQPPTISYELVTGGLRAPVDIVNAHDGSNRLFIVQQEGMIKVWDGTTVSDFIDLSAIINLAGGERGLLSMAFHPGFNGTTNRYFYVYYTNVNGDIEVSRYQTTEGNSNTADPATQTVILTIPHPASAHNGGKLNFGTDGYLYFATGDGGNANDPPNNAQTGTVLLGKMLRIDVDKPGAASHPNYAIPPDNPYVGSGTVADEVWNFGLRNPFRWSFDRVNGNMWIGDVGQGAEEEVDYRPAGSTGHNNFGWHCYEGYRHTPDVDSCEPNTAADYVPPIYTYVHPAVNPPSISITGGFVYRGAEYPNFNGYYIASEFFSGDVILLWPNGSGGFDSSVQAGGETYLAAYGEGEDGTLYAVSDGTDAIYKVVATGGSVLPVVLSRFEVAHSATYNDVKWTTESDANAARFYVEYSIDGNQYTRAGAVPAAGNGKGNSYTFQHRFSTMLTTYYRLAIEDNKGKITYSSIVKVTPDDVYWVKIYPTIIRNRVLNISLSAPASKLQLFNANGAKVFERSLANVSGTTSVSLPALSKGMYFVQVSGDNGIKREKIIIE